MSVHHTPIKTFLGKYYQELLATSRSEKYKESLLETFLEQRFHIQNNKTQMIVDPAMTGLSIMVSGNEIAVSRALYDHPNVTVTNSMEASKENNPKSLYNSEIFSTIAYLICQNNTMFNITGDIDEPIYVTYKSDPETFYNSVIIFRIGDSLDIEIVEEIESRGALNAVVNYMLTSESKLSLTTFYKNVLSGQSFIYRNIIAQDQSAYTHMQFGVGSSNIIDETRLHTYTDVKAELFGCISPKNHNFHTILALQPINEKVDISINHRLVLTGTGVATFMPVISSEIDTAMDVTSLDTTEISNAVVAEKVKEFVTDVADRAILERNTGSARFYKNKSKFLEFH